MNPEKHLHFDFVSDLFLHRFRNELTRSLTN